MAAAAAAGAAGPLPGGAGGAGGSPGAATPGGPDGAGGGGGAAGGATPPPPSGPEAGGPKLQKPRAPRALQLSDRWRERLPPVEDEDLLVTVAAGLGRRVPRRELEGALSVGDPDEEIYRRDPECVECLKDLQRLLRRDDAERGAFLRLGRTRLVQTDLIPLLVHCAHERDVAYNVLKVLTVLTMPLEPGSRTDQEQAEHLKSAKEELLAEPDALTNVLSLLARPLAQHPRMSEEDSLTVQLVIVFVRNLLVPADSEEPSWNGKEREDVIQCLFDTNVVDLLVAAAQHTDEAPFKAEAPLLLDIFHEIFCGFHPEKLLEAARAEAKVLREVQQRAGRRSAQAQEREVQKTMAHSQLGRLLAAEKKQRAAAPRASVRHSRFGGTYLRKYADVASRPMVVRDNPKKSTFKALNHSRPSARTRVAEEKLQAPQDSNKLLARLWRYSKSFLDGSYDILMDVLRHELAHGLGVSRLEPTDFYNYIDLAHFFTRLTRLCVEDGDLPGNFDGARVPQEGEANASPFRHIGATLNLQTITITTNVWRAQAEAPARSDTKDWDMQGAALDLLKEILFTLNLSFYVGTPDDRRAADKLQRRVLYDDARDTGLLATVIAGLKAYPKLKGEQPRSHACSMMETLYIAVKTLERLNEQEKGGFMVRTGREGGRGAAPGAGAGTGAESQAQRPQQGGRWEGEGSPGGLPNTSTQFSGGGGEAHGSARPALKERALDLMKRLSDLVSPQFVTTLGFVLEGYKSNTFGTNHAVYSLMHRIATVENLGLVGVFWNLGFLMKLDALLSDRAEYDGRAVNELRTMARWIVRELLRKMMPDLEGAEEGSARDALRATSELLHVEVLFGMDKREAMRAQDNYALGKAPEAPPAPRQRGLFSPEQVEQLHSLWGEFREEADLVAKVTAAMRECGGDFNEGQIRRKLRQLQLEVPRKRRAKARNSKKRAIEPEDLSETDWELLLYSYKEEEAHGKGLPKLDHVWDVYDDQCSAHVGGPGLELTLAEMARALESRGLAFIDAPRLGCRKPIPYDTDSYSSFSEGEDSDLAGADNLPASRPLEVLRRGDGSRPGGRDSDIWPEDSGSSFSSSFRSGDVAPTQALNTRAEAGEVTSPSERAGVPQAEETAAEEATPPKRRRLSEGPERASGPAGEAETAAAATQEDVAPTQALDFSERAAGLIQVSEAALEDLEAPSEAMPPRGTQVARGRRRAVMLSDSED